MHTPSKNRVKIIATILISAAGIALIAFLSIVGVQLYSNTQTEMYLLETEKKLDNITQKMEAIEVQIDSLATNTAEREPEAAVPATTEPEATVPFVHLTPQPEEIRRRRRGGGGGGSVQPTTAPTAMPQINSETGPGICRRHPNTTAADMNSGASGGVGNDNVGLWPDGAVSTGTTPVPIPPVS